MSHAGTIRFGSSAISIVISRDDRNFITSASVNIFMAQSQSLSNPYSTLME